jgi:hypothetical protein
MSKKKSKAGKPVARSTYESVFNALAQSCAEVLELTRTVENLRMELVRGGRAALRMGRERDKYREFMGAHDLAARALGEALEFGGQHSIVGEIHAARRARLADIHERFDKARIDTDLRWAQEDAAALMSGSGSTAQTPISDADLCKQAKG